MRPVARHWAAAPSQKETRGPPEGAYGEAPAQLVLRRGPDRKKARPRRLRVRSRVRVKSLALKVRSSIPTACATRSRPDASYSTVGVGDQLSFRLMQDSQFVAKRVAYSRATADHYVEWGQNRLAPGLQKDCESLVDVGDKMSVSGPIWRCTTSSASVSGKPKPAASSLRHNSR